MQIEIVSVATSYTKTAKGGYSTAEVQYVNEGGQSRKQKVVSFGNPKVFDTLKEAIAGQKYDITTTQNGDFTNWSSATLLAEGAPAASSSAPAAKTAAVSQYETRDERNARQRLIVRQSCLSNAVTILATGSKSPPETQAVKDLANELVAFVFEAPDLFEQPDDIPY